MEKIKVDKHSFKADQHKKDIVNKLRNHFNNKVMGRIIDLCKPKSEKYYSALTVALMSNFDSVVVDCLDTAKKCISFLKEHSFIPMTFLSLQQIKFENIEDRHMNFGGTCK